MVRTSKLVRHKRNNMIKFNIYCFEKIFSMLTFNNKIHVNYEYILMNNKISAYLIYLTKIIECGYVG